MCQYLIGRCENPARLLLLLRARFGMPFSAVPYGNGRYQSVMLRAECAVSANVLANIRGFALGCATVLGQQETESQHNPNAHTVLAPVA